MASFRTDMEIDGIADPIPVNRLFFTATRKRDQRGRPASSTNWIIHVTIDALEDSTITQWMVDPHMQKAVTIKFYKIDEEESVLKQWKLEKAYCYAMGENFVADASFMTTELIIAGQEISNGNATLQYNWQ